MLTGPLVLRVVALVLLGVDAWLNPAPTRITTAALAIAVASTLA